MMWKRSEKMTVKLTRPYRTARRVRRNLQRQKGIRCLVRKGRVTKDRDRYVEKKDDKRS